MDARAATEAITERDSMMKLKGDVGRFGIDAV